jgi:hypothetical protein
MIAYEVRITVHKIVKDMSTGNTIGTMNEETINSMSQSSNDFGSAKRLFDWLVNSVNKLPREKKVINEKAKINK